MLFNSITYFLFLPCVLFIYWYILGNNYKLQNILIVVASYIFYGWWDWRFLGLIILSTIIDYNCGKYISLNSGLRKKIYLYFSVIANLGILFYFKYSNFFLESLRAGLENIGINLQIATSLNIILPVGISFYTFQTMSYTIDVYRKHIEPTRDYFAFSFYVSFFPQLVAGPIERAGAMLSQITRSRQKTLQNSVIALHMIIWGLFKKIVIADSLAPWVDIIFSNHEIYGSFTLLLGILFFSIQIYCDFSGYSTIAIGTAKLFGIDLMTNFNYPYLSKNIVQFWKKWHISLSSWFRDYVFIPLGGSRVSRERVTVNVFITFIISGLWHGANFTYIAWGLTHSFLYMINLNFQRMFTSVWAARNYNIILGKVFDYINIIITFTVVSLTWVLFRSATLTDSINYYVHLFRPISVTNDLNMNIDQIVTILIILLFYFIFGFVNKSFVKSKVTSYARHLIFDSTLITFAILFGTYSSQSFIYFQF
jgi:alginate O-acetyltransferase complex protein AlgI